MKPFRFKQFSIEHSESSMPVGLDAILLGTWVTPIKAGHVLDVGTGCGILALICAQRMNATSITAIDIDEPSVEEARSNFHNSPWRDILTAEKKDFRELSESNDEMKWDLIISNPPYFNSGITSFANPRIKARHESVLSPTSLIEFSALRLKSGGKMAMIAPTERKFEILETLKKNGMTPYRLCNIIPRAGMKSKRFMLEAWLFPDINEFQNIEEENLVIEIEPGTPTREFRELTKDFYLNF